jgi:transcription elongation factor Elf1
MNSIYILQKMDKSFCPKCNEKVYLLCSKGIGDKPSFFICFDCETVGQVGIGSVEKLEVSDVL